MAKNHNTTSWLTASMSAKRRFEESAAKAFAVDFGTGESPLIFRPSRGTNVPSSLRTSSVKAASLQSPNA